ncbi:dephospho-CoA kinase [Aureimonas fodinaquatilis]|uniref:Dephospho-CoA kinase n=1 Tax=Aureimonas fodinaquatilis TaxID=2565783 RepID=A0A5B0DT01_9HYPH|nr:dephospho-CoA kinase [Aureimonas fodinaquatilis]KAA0968249.1 dephospho-CoA kinase [Aureimonas fodinaquatilis]
MVILGLTGSIGMGKSTTADMFAELGVPIHSADAAVHAIYSGPDAKLIEKQFPGTVIDGVVDRGKLAAQVLDRPEALSILEKLVHPLVRQAETEFLKQAREAGRTLVVLDIPLLFETGREAAVDAVLVVTAPADVQRQRVFARPGMTLEKLRNILARQMPDEEKRQKADFIIDTSLGLDHARKEVASIVNELG